MGNMDRKKPTLLETEHIEYLNQTVHVIVSKKHTFGTDALLLADFANPRHKDYVCDFGTGCGIIPMLWFRDGKGAHIDGIELQAAGYDQFCRTIESNNAEALVFAHHLDLKQAADVLEKGKYDCITMNPPYTPVGRGIQSQKPHEQAARHEIHCAFADIFSSARQLLRYGGRMSVCFRPERLAEAMQEMQAQKLEPKRLRFVAKNPACAPWLCLLEGRYGGKSGIEVLPNLFLYNEDGTYTEEMRRIYGAYKEKGATT